MKIFWVAYLADKVFQDLEGGGACDKVEVLHKEIVHRRSWDEQTNRRGRPPVSINRGSSIQQRNNAMSNLTILYILCCVGSVGAIHVVNLGSLQLKNGVARSGKQHLLDSAAMHGQLIGSLLQSQGSVTHNAFDCGARLDKRRAQNLASVRRQNHSVMSGEGGGYGGMSGLHRDTVILSLRGGDVCDEEKDQTLGAKDWLSSLGSPAALVAGARHSLFASRFVRFSAVLRTDHLHQM